MGIKRILQRIRVPLGFAAAAAFFLLSRPGWTPLAAGLPLIAAGIWIRFWAAGHIRKNQEITRSGPYGFTRNPLYLGSCLTGAGFAIQSGWWWLPLLFLLLFGLLYFPVMRQEEKELENGFGPEFRRYRDEIPLFLPRFRRIKEAGRPFSFQAAWQNREYNAPLGALAAELVLVMKIYGFFPFQIQ